MIQDEGLANIKVPATGASHHVACLSTQPNSCAYRFRPGGQEEATSDTANKHSYALLTVSRNVAPDFGRLGITETSISFVHLHLRLSYDAQYCIQVLCQGRRGLHA
jgi:hypothetical protein